MARTRVDETREGVDLTNLDQPLFEGAGATKREHIDYLDGVADRILPALRDRPLSVIRTTRGQAPFFQKNLPDYTPEWVARVSVWAEASHRDVSYALCNDRRTLLWFGNQRAVEFHPALAFADRLERGSQDERRQGSPRVRADHGDDQPARCRRGHQGAGAARRATRPCDRHDG